MRLWQAHGLVIGCDDVALDVRPLDDTDRPVDISFRVLAPGPVPEYGTTLPGRPLAHYDDQQGSALSVVERWTDDVAPRRLVDVCFHGVATGTLDNDSGTATLRLAPEADPGLASVLISGTLLSVFLMVTGHPVLHASAAVLQQGHEPGAIAFVGRSGMGKSTMATLLCRDGGALLTDDVLRTDLTTDGVVLAWPGATALRLRPGAHDLGVAAAGAVSTTADERYSASPGLAASDPVPLTALVVPQPDRESDQISVTRLEGARAVLAISSFPRILGWTDPVTSGEALRHWGELARRIPVLVMQVPWGPPFAADLGGEVVAAVRAAL